MATRELICNGDRYSVWMTSRVAKAFDRAEARFRARCIKLMHKYAECGEAVLIETQFKFQERLSMGDKQGTRVAIYAFKAYQLRVYGGLIPGTNQFVCTEIEVTKKRDEADRSLLERAARYLGQFADHQEGARR